MLLEMDQSEVIHLIESPEDLKIKVSEAMQVLHEAASGSEVGDQLGSLWRTALIGKAGQPDNGQEQAPML
ncbi:Polyadenylate-binding protein 2 [Spatholobus suberectus]|nr:Polyadenylate-binding protein 2 [Spatholobus suberectus]